MSNSPLSPSPAGFPPTTLTPCPTPPSSVFSRLSQLKTVAKQLEEAAVGALPPNPTIGNLPKITWKNRCFVLEDLAHRITPASQSSESSPGDEGVIDIYSGARPKRRRLEQSAIPRAKIKAIQELSVGFVIDSDVPFHHLRAQLSSEDLPPFRQ
ncbi:hypothetical protein FOQG_17755 [Fusarium oxysporum f. sp. raphani 54005]|uniref:Uncharacterized protein n=1 Tax=Fusarium oxysporum f. sp. raphani 54005 TaxID=1089458 RepID=X0B5V9_FUSOX|nr:hypothetical protein FOQG_17755 [Fusarium oxysporum f. sp. raphani 54005]